MADLITFDFYKAWPGSQNFATSAQESASKPMIDMAISIASQQMVSAMGRPLFVATRTEYHNLYDGTRAVWLEATPVASITSVHASSDATWDATTLLVVGDDYRFGSRTGKLELLTPQPIGPDALRVIYSGGLVADQDALLTEGSEYYYLAVACAQQVHDFVLRRNSLGFTSDGSGRGAASFKGPVELLPHVRALCDELRPTRIA